MADAPLVQVPPHVVGRLQRVAAARGISLQAAAVLAIEHYLVFEGDFQRRVAEARRNLQHRLHETA